MVFSTSQVYIRLSWYLVTGLYQVVMAFSTGLHQVFRVFSTSQVYMRVIMVFITSQVYIRLSWYLVCNRFT